MIRIPLLVGLILGAVFWNRPGNSVPVWPSTVPALAVRPTQATQFTNGAIHVAGASRHSPEQALQELRAAYQADGWRECPVSETLADFALFVKGSAVAAAHVRPTGQGSFISILQRPKGM